ncbi:TolC family protein, partial [candidate division WOR-3 bacterium]|nr:TolC family protein [candidate division WOR-3 bacterium]
KYFAVLSYQERLHIDSIITSREEENIKKSEIMFKNGIISRTDLLNIQSNFYTIQAAYHSDKKEYIKAKSDFSVLTGITSKEHFEDIDSIPLIDMNNWDIENILADLPEYKIFKYYYSIKSINVASASSSFLPTASLSIGAGLSDSVLDFDYNNFMDNYSLNAGLSIDFPVFTGFSRTIGVINSSLEKKGAYLDMINQENILRTEIKNFPLTVEQILALFKSNINIMMAQYDIFEKSVKMYGKGEISSLDYISYQKNYYDAVINLLEAKKHLYLTYYRYLYYLRRIQ